MKKISILLSLTVLMTFTACGENQQLNTQALPQSAESDTPIQSQITETSIPMVSVVRETTATEWVSPYERVGMPAPYVGMNGCGYIIRYRPNFTDSSGISDDFARYLGLSDDEFADAISEKLGFDVTDTNIWNNMTPPIDYLHEIPNLFWYIINFDIPDEVIISAINKNNEFGERMRADNESRRETPQYIVDYRAYEVSIFNDDEISALLSRDAERVNAVFANEHAIVIGDKAIPPAWLYLHTPEDYARVGITPEMVAEKLPLYAEFYFTDEADAAFSEKLSEFVGREVSLKQIRSQIES